MPHKHFPVMLDVGAMNKTMPDPLDRKVRMELPRHSSLYIMSRRMLLETYAVLTHVEAGTQLSHAQAGGKAGQYKHCERHCTYCKTPNILAMREDASYCDAAIEEGLRVDGCPAIDWDEAAREARDTLENIYHIGKNEIDSLNVAVLTREEQRMLHEVVR